MIAKQVVAILLICSFILLVSCRHEKEALRIELESDEFFMANSVRHVLSDKNFFVKQRRGGWRNIVIGNPGNATVDVLYIIQKTLTAAGYPEVLLAIGGMNKPVQLGPIANLPFAEFCQLTNDLHRVFICSDGIFIDNEKLDAIDLGDYVNNRKRGGCSALEIYAAIGTPLCQLIDVMSLFSGDCSDNIFIVIGYSDDNCNSEFIDREEDKRSPP